ncbi:hypothetical protein GCM10010399_09240 [Dactylosporangium fulvum]|uniref:Class I SAM-dependent methyltransferase n=1 Tax=Dactylosporangium fulvum TaxID=53359 RepID=A0ABY5W9M2_9ACTN|nr:class I SAM-dependent methyltransferase [Dactylosporangium fulvum]UWP86753.1 class I SAM-dependent methyltransferase [Dactylosporangium fulvum]
MNVARSAVEAWNEEYKQGRYANEPPVDFVEDILSAAWREGISAGLYIGCGNGRNLLPLVDSGLDLLGLDVSDEAIRQLTQARPDRASHLVCGDLEALPAGHRWPLVVAIQVFQHGNRHEAHEHVRAAQARVESGGLLCVRVNAVGTDVWPSHEVVERDPDDGFSVRYTAGPKNGLTIHFFSAAELDTMCTGWTPVLPLRAHQTERTPPGIGRWTQWEAIWRRS